MSWNYRVVRKDGEVTIYSVYYDDIGKIVGYGKSPLGLWAADEEELETNLQLMLDALKKDTIEADSFPADAAI